MRNATLLLVISLIFGVSVSFAQSFDLDLNNTVIPTSITMGKTIPVTGDIQNHGPDDYLTQNGKITMNVHARYTPLAANDSFDVQPITSFEISVSRINSGQTISYSGGFIADPANFRVGHSGVTVIVWPKISIDGGGTGVGDTIIKNHYFFTQVNVDGSTTKIDDILADVNVQLYPNPATHNVKVSFEKPLTGTLRLMDLQGKELMSTVVTPQVLEYNVELMGLDLTSGMYLVNFEGEEGFWTKKLIVTNN